jgi:hypothetical protein
MTDSLLKDENGLDLPEDERARIRAEMRYAMLAVKEAPSDHKPKTILEQVLGYLSNGFVLLLIGSLITSGLVPRFQREYESRKQRSTLMEECLGQFLLYGNSLWQEYYSILPLTLQSEMSRAEYIAYLTRVSEIKLKRYDSYAKVRALSLVFRDGKDQESPVEAALDKYAVTINSASAQINDWLSKLYCTPTKRRKSPCTTFDHTFDSYSEYKEIQTAVVGIGNQGAQSVAQLMVDKISSSH